MELHHHRRKPFGGVSFILLLTLLHGLHACILSREAEPEPAEVESLNLRGGQELPSSPTSPTSDYKLGSGDVLNILVYGEPDLTTVARVNKEGFIEFPLIGKVQASGLTAGELKQSIEDKLKTDYLVDPDVQIILQEFRQDMVHLIGQVAAPGPYRITHSNTLMETISKAGGFTPIAKRKKVKVIRKENGKSRVFFVDTRRITDQGRLEEDVILMPGDVIIIPERFF